MQNKSRAFTLIELLVVVLIIGILAAIAVPQYQKAVDKARLTEMLIQGRALLEAQQLYYTANGTTTADLSNLDISMPVSSWWCSSENCTSQTVAGVRFTVSSYYGYHHLSLHCMATANSYAEQLCSSMGGQYSHENAGNAYYLIYKK